MLSTIFALKSGCFAYAALTMNLWTISEKRSPTVLSVRGTVSDLHWMNCVTFGQFFNPYF